MRGSRVLAVEASTIFCLLPPLGLDASEDFSLRVAGGSGLVGTVLHIYCSFLIVMRVAVVAVAAAASVVVVAAAAAAAVVVVVGVLRHRHRGHRCRCFCA